MFWSGAGLGLWIAPHNQFFSGADSHRWSHAIQRSCTVAGIGCATGFQLHGSIAALAEALKDCLINNAERDAWETLCGTPSASKLRAT
jgi:hypothetical protein